MKRAASHIILTIKFAPVRGQRIESKSTPERKAEVKNNYSRPRVAVNGDRNQARGTLGGCSGSRKSSGLAESRQTIGPGDIQKGYYCELGWEKKNLGERAVKG
jgi:hypothetical protein